jgi:hypothetical protein
VADVGTPPADRQQAAGRTAAAGAVRGRPAAGTALSRLAAAGGLLALAILALHALLRGRLVIGHDSLHYPPRLVEWMRALADGHLPPVWAPDLGHGFGQPLFEFAPPLLYLVATPFRLAGANLPNAVQLAVALVVAAGGVAVYRLARRQGGPRDAAVVVAAAWLFSPYLALDLFVRGAFAEALGLATLPVAILALRRALDGPTPRRLAAAATAVALLPLAHFPVALLALPPLGAVAVAHGLGRRRLGRSVAVAAATFVAGLALAAFSWLPALVEKRFVKVDLLREEALHWRLHAVSPSQLFVSPWGHGLSVEGPGDGMSFAIGPLHLLLAAAGLAMALWSGDRQRRCDALVFALLAATGAWLATTASAPLWERLPLLQYLAFPWRALMLPALFCSLLALPALGRLPAGWRFAALAGIVGLGLPHTEPKGYNRFADSYFAPAEIARKGVRTTTLEEYEPRWVERRPPWTEVRLRPLGGAEATVLEQDLEADRQRFAVRLPLAARMEVATFWYPGWTATVDGGPAPIEVLPGTGTMAVALPAGEHHLELELGPTAVRRGSLLASGLTAAVLAAAALAGGRRRRAPGSPLSRETPATASPGPG